MSGGNAYSICYSADAACSLLPFMRKNKAFKNQESGLFAANKYCSSGGTDWHGYNNLSRVQNLCCGSYFFSGTGFLLFKTGSTPYIV